MILTVEENFNKQNNIMYAHCAHVAKIIIKKVVMFWWSVSHDEITNIDFYKKGVKISA